VTAYAAFIAGKERRHLPIGIDVNVTDVHPMLHPWQAELVVWATKVGRAAVWADTGLGKTVIQVEWLRLMAKRGLIIAPLAVCAQTIREAAKVGVAVTYLREGGADLAPGMYITNYEVADRFDPAGLDAVVLDEASILKQSTGKTRTLLIKHFAPVAYRLACTATPAPNDTEELTSQAEFLGVIPRQEMLAAYFVHDQDGWRVKKHARRSMYAWISSWAVAIRRPSDMGYPDDGYALPGLEIHSHLLDVDVVPEGQLFATDIGGVGGRSRVRKATLAARVEKAVELVRQDTDQWVIWVGLNDEQDALLKLLGTESRSIDGRTPLDDRITINEDWIAGKFRVLLVKPGMYSFGMNWQHCAQMAFVGLSDSYESYYQCIRRCFRYGQTRIVHAHVVLSQLEGQIAANVRRKESEAASTTAALVAEMRAARDAA